MGRLDGKVAFITGAARGQGRSHAIGMAAEGADIIAIDICGPIPNLPYAPATPKDLEETERAVKETGRRVKTGIVDIRDAAALAGFVDDAVAEFGRLDAVVANAGICIPGAWDAITDQVWRDTLDINLTGTWHTARATVPHLLAAGGGSLILVSSVAGLRPQPFLAPYVASKYAVTGLAGLLSVELADKNVRVNSIHPGPVNSPMGSGNSGIHQLIAASPKLGQIFQMAMPVGAVEPEDVTKAVIFLASDESRHITGLKMNVDAGAMHM